MCIPKAPKVRPVTTGNNIAAVEQAPTADVATPVDAATSIEETARTRQRKGISALRTTKAPASGLQI